jgi:hypothetical protein
MKIARTDLLSLGALLILQVLLFPPATFTSSNLLASKYSDVITQHLPHQIFIRQSLFQNKCLPLWNPYECAGTPAFPNPLYLTFAFPHLLLIWLPPPLTLNVGFFLHIFLAGALTYAFARQIGCARTASLFAAFVFSLCARSLSQVQAGAYPNVVYLAYIPLFFICAERCITSPDRRASLTMAACMTLALLTGEIQMYIYSSLLLILFSFLRCRCTPDQMRAVTSPGKALRSVFSGMLLSLPLSAFYIIPACRLYPLLTRSLPLGKAQFSLMPALSNLRLLLNPYLLSNFSASTDLPWESAIYIGLAPLMVIVWMLFQKSSHRDLRLWGSLTVVTLLFSLRELKPLHLLLNMLFPAITPFRNPGRMLFFFPFFAALLAGRGLHVFSFSHSPGEGSRAARFWLCVLLIAIIMLCSAFAWLSREDIGTLMHNYCQRFSSFFGSGQLGILDMHTLRREASSFKTAMLSSLVFQSMIMVVLSALFILRDSRRIPLHIFSIFLLAAAYADLFYFGKQYLEVHPMEEIYPPSMLYRSLERAEHTSRLLDMSARPVAPFWTALSFFQSTGLGVSRVDGYTPVNLTSYVRYIDLLRGRSKTAWPRWGITVPSIQHPSLLSLLNTDFLISESPRALTSLTLVEEFRDVPVYRQFLGSRVLPHLFLYRNADSFPEAWLVPKAEVCESPEEDRRMTILDFRQEVLLPRGSRPLNGGELYRAVPISRHGPDLISIELETRRPSYLCLSEIWAPGWGATDNGERVHVARINTTFRGIYLEPGKHSVRLSYWPPGIGVGLVVSATTAVVLIAVALSAKRRRLGSV